MKDTDDVPSGPEEVQDEDLPDEWRVFTQNDRRVDVIRNHTTPYASIINNFGKWNIGRHRSTGHLINFKSRKVDDFEEAFSELVDLTESMSR